MLGDCINLYKVVLNKLILGLFVSINKKMHAFSWPASTVHISVERIFLSVYHILQWELDELV